MVKLSYGLHVAQSAVGRLTIRSSSSMQICNPSTESTQGRSHSSVSSVTSALEKITILEVTLGYTQEKNHSCVSSATRGSAAVIICNHTTSESTQERSHSSVSSATGALYKVTILNVTLGYTQEKTIPVRVLPQEVQPL